VFASGRQDSFSSLTPVSAIKALRPAKIRPARRPDLASEQGGIGYLDSSDLVQLFEHSFPTLFKNLNALYSEEPDAHHLTKKKSSLVFGPKLAHRESLSERYHNARPIRVIEGDCRICNASPEL
jgi:hypothetical protein